MAKNSSAQPLIRKIRDPKLVMRAILGALLAANLIAVGLLRFPPGGSADDLRRQMAVLQKQIAAKGVTLKQTREHALQVKQGRDEGDQFVHDYFLPLRSYSGILNSELQRDAIAAKIKPKPAQLNVQPIEGSDTLQMVSVTASYEGLYPDVLKFVHSIDQSPLLLIIESLNAVPQQGSNMLDVSIKMEAFVRAGEDDQ
jgi:hypothetical protein